MPEIDVCCCCGVEIPDKVDQCFINFRYHVPTSGKPDNVLVAVICPKCAAEADVPALFPVIEGLIVARIARIEHPNKMFTPD